MYVEHMRKDFYELLHGKRLLILTSHDVDSVSACKIMQYLFMIDQITYTIISCEGVAELKSNFTANSLGVKHVLLINCGGTVDLMELFGNPPDVLFFVLDSHRPTHILNVYDESKQIRIVTPPVDDEGLPAFDEIFRVELSDTEESSDEDEENREVSEADEDSPDMEFGDGEDGQVNRPRKKRTRMHLHLEQLEKAKERRTWEDNRRRLLFDYTQHSFYGAPASLIALEVAWSMTRSDNDVVWWAIVGLTEFFVLRRIERGNYTLLVSELQTHVQRIKFANSSSLTSLKITFDNDLSLFLYRHWSIWDSIKSTPTWACKLSLWSQKGEQRLKQYMCEVGLPLREVKQLYGGMAFDLKRDLKEILNKRAEKFGLADEMYFGTFFAQYGYGFKVSALDNYLATLALLDQPHTQTQSHRYLNALNSLCKDRAEVNEGLELAQLMIKTVNRQVQAFLEMQQFNVTSSIIYVVAQEGGIETDWFGKPGCLVILAQYALRAFIESSPRKSVRQLPLVLMAPQNKNNYLAVGIPPITTHVTHNLFGKAFEQVSARMPETVVMDCFETAICQVKATHKEKFLEMLVSLLTD